MSTPATELHPCACGCGEMVRRKYARGHYARVAARNRKLTPLPGPDVPDDELDMGLLEPDEEVMPHARHETVDSRPDVTAAGPEDNEEIEPDRPPGHLSAPPGGRSDRPGRKIRVTATVRKDIAAKVGMVLFMPGKVWETRDPWCGGTFMRQLPATTDALADIICDSADLVAFFTGPAGGFMKYLNLAAALQPVAVMMWGHHIAHSVDGEANGQVPQPDMARYAA